MGEPLKLIIMSRLLSRFFTSAPVMIFLGVFIFLAMLVGDPFHLKDSRTEEKWQERMANIDMYMTALRPADTLPHKKWTGYWDSIQNIRRYEDDINYDKRDNYIGYWPLGLFGLHTSTGCTECDVIVQNDNYVYPVNDRKKEYYIVLKGFRLNDHRYFFRDRGTDFVFNSAGKKPSWAKTDTAVDRLRFHDKIDKLFLANSYRVPFRYDYWNEIILIPVSKKAYNTFDVINIITGIIVGIYILVLFINVPYRIIRNIALGRAFDVRTIRLVDFLAYNFLLFPFIVFFYRCLTFLIARNYITSDLKFTAWKELFGSGAILYIGLILFALGVALKKGFKLQREQDLTI